MKVEKLSKIKQLLNDLRTTAKPEDLVLIKNLDKKINDIEEENRIKTISKTVENFTNNKDIQTLSGLVGDVKQLLTELTKEKEVIVKNLDEIKPKSIVRIENTEDFPTVVAISNLDEIRPKEKIEISNLKEITPKKFPEKIKISNLDEVVNILNEILDDIKKPPYADDTQIIRDANKKISRIVYTYPEYTKTLIYTRDKSGSITRISEVRQMAS